MQSLIKIQKGEDCKSINLPPEVRLVPSSCRGLQYVPGDGLHVRLLVQADLNTSKRNWLISIIFMLKMMAYEL